MSLGAYASEATRVVYGGTPLSCRAEGHKRLERLTPAILWVFDRGLEQMSCDEMEVFWARLAEARG